MLPISDSMLIRRLDLGRRPICHSLIHRGYVQHRGFGVGAPHLSGSDAGLLSSLTPILGTPQFERRRALKMVSDDHRAMVPQRHGACQPGGTLHGWLVKGRPHPHGHQDGS